MVQIFVCFFKLVAHPRPHVGGLTHCGGGGDVGLASGSTWPHLLRVLLCRQREHPQRHFVPSWGDRDCWSGIARVPWGMHKCQLRVPRCEAEQCIRLGRQQEDAMVFLRGMVNEKDAMHGRCSWEEWSLRKMPWHGVPEGNGHWESSSRLTELAQLILGRIAASEASRSKMESPSCDKVFLLAFENRYTNWWYRSVTIENMSQPLQRLFWMYRVCEDHVLQQQSSWWL